MLSPAMSNFTYIPTYLTVSVTFMLYAGILEHTEGILEGTLLHANQKYSHV